MSASSHISGVYARLSAAMVLVTLQTWTLVACEGPTRDDTRAEDAPSKSEESPQSADGEKAAAANETLPVVMAPLPIDGVNLVDAKPGCNELPAAHPAVAEARTIAPSAVVSDCFLEAPLVGGGTRRLLAEDFPVGAQIIWTQGLVVNADVTVVPEVRDGTRPTSARYTIIPRGVLGDGDAVSVTAEAKVTLAYTPIGGTKVESTKVTLLLSLMLLAETSSRFWSPAAFTVIDKIPRESAVDYPGAVATCAAAGARLPTVTEINAIRFQSNSGGFGSVAWSWTLLEAKRTGMHVDFQVVDGAKAQLPIAFLADYNFVHTGQVFDQASYLPGPMGGDITLSPLTPTLTTFTEPSAPISNDVVANILTHYMAPILESTPELRKSWASSYRHTLYVQEPALQVPEPWPLALAYRAPALNQNAPWGEWGLFAKQGFQASTYCARLVVDALSATVGNGNYGPPAAWSPRIQNTSNYGLRWVTSVKDRSSIRSLKVVRMRPEVGGTYFSQSCTPPAAALVESKAPTESLFADQVHVRETYEFDMCGIGATTQVVLLCGEVDGIDGLQVLDRQSYALTTMERQRCQGVAMPWELDSGSVNFASKDDKIVGGEPEISVYFNSAILDFPAGGTLLVGAACDQGLGADPVDSTFYSGRTALYFGKQIDACLDKRIFAGVDPKAYQNTPGRAASVPISICMDTATLATKWVGLHVGSPEIPLCVGPEDGMEVSGGDLDERALHLVGLVAKAEPDRKYYLGKGLGADCQAFASDNFILNEPPAPFCEEEWCTVDLVFSCARALEAFDQTAPTRVAVCAESEKGLYNEVNFAMLSRERVQAACAPMGSNP